MVPIFPPHKLRGEFRQVRLLLVLQRWRAAADEALVQSMGQLLTKLGFKCGFGLLERYGELSKFGFDGLGLRALGCAST